MEYKSKMVALHVYSGQSFIINVRKILPPQATTATQIEESWKQS